MEDYFFFRYTQSILNFEQDTTSYRAYWAPIEERLPQGTQTLLVSNDGVFNQINLATIPLPGGGYLVDKYQVIYHSRLASLGRPPKPIKYYEGRKAWIVADPDYNGGLPSDSVYVPDLPGTAQEARALQDLFQSAGILPYVYTRREASELRAKQAHSPYILHIATHGVFLPYDERIGELIGIQSSSALANPLFRSALLLADAGRTMVSGGSSNPENDGFLNAYELLALSLENTEVVALSACETGLGEVQNGEGVYGLQRAFLIAGARNLILSLWKVDDEATRDFMVNFYRQWLVVGLPIAEAFWATQKEMRKARPQPYFWGAFVLVRP
jgi:CHAT domain-containing protein